MRRALVFVYNRWNTANQYCIQLQPLHRCRPLCRSFCSPLLVGTIYWTSTCFFASEYHTFRVMRLPTLRRFLKAAAKNGRPELWTNHIEASLKHLMARGGSPLPGWRWRMRMRQHRCRRKKMQRTTDTAATVKMKSTTSTMGKKTVLIAWRCKACHVVVHFNEANASKSLGEQSGLVGHRWNLYRPFTLVLLVRSTA